MRAINYKGMINTIKFANILSMDVPLTTFDIFKDINAWRSERISPKFGDYSHEFIDT